MTEDRDETVWFWYNPQLGSVVQEDVDPYHIHGLFDTEDDAREFLDYYAEQYDLPDTSHLELYSAEISLEDVGGHHFHTEQPSGPDAVETATETEETTEYVLDQRTLQHFTEAGGSR